MTRTEITEKLMKCELIDEAYCFLTDIKDEMGWTDEDVCDWLDLYMQEKQYEEFLKEHLK